MHHRPRPARYAAALATALILASSTPASAASRLDGDGQCTYPASPIPGQPWALQRILLNQLWQYGQGAGIRVAVTDTGVDNRNPQLRTAVDTRDGIDLITPGGNGTDDTVGHGTEVAGIIAARPAPGTGFVGIAPKATIIPVRQNDDRGDGTAATLATAIHKAVAAGAKVINISQDTAATPGPGTDLAQAVQYALNQDVVVIASAGNNGQGGQRHTTYPAAYPGVLAVGASDRDNQRADFSQSGPFIGVAAPGVDMVSTVPVGGQCVDNGTSFSAPYVAGVAALIREKHPDWKQNQVVAQIEQTADRTTPGRANDLGWGVVDPVRALTEDPGPLDHPVAERDPGQTDVRVDPAALGAGAAAQRRADAIATYAVGGAGLLVTLIAGTAIVARDARRLR